MHVYRILDRPLGKFLILTVFPFFLFSAYGQIPPETAVDQANRELWGKFIDKYGIVNNFVGERPTPFDCRLSRPNAFGWWTPIEDGAFYTGNYLVATCKRAEFTQSDTDRDKARILAQGLLRLASVSDVPGFIARGVSTDGKTHYPIGSNDQSFPWFYGLYTYYKTDIPSSKEKEIIKKKIVEVVDAIRLNNWRFPSDGTFTGDYRDSNLDNRFLDVPLYLCMLRVMFEITSDESWLNWYHRALNQKPEGAEMTRAEICSEGIQYDVKRMGLSEKGTYLWICVAKQAALAELSKLEKDESIRSYFSKGLNRNREFVMKFANNFSEFDNHDSKVFGNTNWRECYPYWHPQFTLEDAISVAGMRENEKIGRRKAYEREFATTPLAAASIIALAEQPNDFKLIEKVVSHYDYSKLYLSEFLYAEYAFYKVKRN